ncbi:hypothetical protein HK102_000263 [Quaeritorhiza haematococci]|nr:hypothetical protein HK102_000263 [Quaeritorhiza haematococci]
MAIQRQTNAKQLELDVRKISKLFLQQNLKEASQLGTTTLKRARTQGVFQPANPAHKLLLLLNLRIAAQSVDLDFESTWNDVVSCFAGVEALPADVLILGILEFLKRNRFRACKDTIEKWLAAQPDAFYLKVAQGIEPEAIDCERIVELYVLHMLPALQDWNGAFQFLEFNETLPAGRREVYKKHLAWLKEQNDKGKLDEKREQSQITSQAATKTTSTNISTAKADVKPRQSEQSSANKSPVDAVAKQGNRATGAQPAQSSNTASTESKISRNVSATAAAANNLSTSNRGRSIFSRKHMFSAIPAVIFVLVIFQFLRQRRDRTSRNSIWSRAWEGLFSKLTSTLKMATTM